MGAGPVEALRAGRIAAWFQPIRDLRTGRLYGYEALARWPDGGAGPAIFVPQITSSPFASRLFAEMAGAAADAIAGTPPPVRVSVNLPAEDIGAARTHDILRALAERGTDMSRLTIEVTEEAFGHGRGETLVALAALKRRGIKLALDDFGSGSADLHRLRAFPFDILKLDMGFGADLRPAARADRRRVLRQARDRGLTVIAEGVEDARDARRLRDEGITWGQGFHFGRARPRVAEAPAP